MNSPNICYIKTLKTDILGKIELIKVDNRQLAVCRDINHSSWWIRPLAYYLALREKKCLQTLEQSNTNSWPKVLSWGHGQLIRTYIQAKTLNDLQPQNPLFYENAKELLNIMHAYGVTHNDLAKEANWLAIDHVTPAITDFQLGWVFRRKGIFYKTCVREDYRHLLKHKETYCSEYITPDEKEILQNKSTIATLVVKIGKPLYHFITRGILHYSDHENTFPRTLR